MTELTAGSLPRSKDAPKITRKGLLIGGGAATLLTAATTALVPSLRRAAKEKAMDATQQASYGYIEKLGRDVCRHIKPELQAVVKRPDRVNTVQPADNLANADVPPQELRQYYEDKQGQEVLRQGLLDLYYDGQINLAISDDSLAETEVTDILTGLAPGIASQIEAFVSDRANGVTGDTRIDQLVPQHKITGAVIDKKTAVSEILERIIPSLEQRNASCGITFNRPTYQEEARADGTVIARDIQLEAAIRRRRSRGSQQEATAEALPNATPLAAGLLSGLRGRRATHSAGYQEYMRYYNENYGSTARRTPGSAHLSRRRFLTLVPAAVVSAGAVAAGVTAATDASVIPDKAAEMAIPEINENAWNMIEEKLPLLMERPFRMKGITTFLDKDGREIHKIVNQRRIPTVFGKIAPSVVDALVATEDSTFWENAGVEITSVARAAIGGGESGGGSTLTQQLVKMACWSEEENAALLGDKAKKVAEIYMAVILKDKLTEEYMATGLDHAAARRKAGETIMEAYMNLAPFGAGVYGVETASQYYFGKSADQLTLGQATMLAGIPQGSSLYDPYFQSDDKTAYTPKYIAQRTAEGYITPSQDQYLKTVDPTLQLTKARQAVVLHFMVQSGEIDQAQAEAALKEDLGLLPYEEMQKRRQTTASESDQHFCRYVQHQLDANLPPQLAGSEMTVRTTLDRKMQDQVGKIVGDYLPEIAAFQPQDVSVFVRNIKTGDILATYGDIVTDHPPGSTVKAATYAQALAEGGVIRPNGDVNDIDIDLIVDRDGKQTPWHVRNFEIAAQGLRHWKAALAQSFNGAAANIGMKMGAISVARAMERFGLYGDLTDGDGMPHTGWTTTLGTQSAGIAGVSQLYSTIGNDGRRVNSRPVTEIRDSNGNALYQSQGATGQQVMAHEVSAEVRDALGNNDYRPDNALWTPIRQTDGEKPFFAKTGTSDENESGRHVWTAGVCGDYAIVVYVNTPKGINSSGLMVAAPLFRRIKKDLFG